MANKPGGFRTLALALASALVLFALILLAFFFLSGSSEHTRITLPDALPDSAEPTGEDVEEGTFLQVDADNAAQVVATLARPASYYQTFSILTAWPDESATRTAELWVSGGVSRIDINDGTATRSVLTDGKTAYVWYDGDTDAAEFALGDALSVDSLTGVPTYERITAPGASIEQAGFVRLDDLDGQSCIFVQISDGEYVDRYWVDVSMGLLCRATTSRNQTLVYQLRETSSERLLATDEALTAAFSLPDGTLPFASEE